jgi:hypothetical protein
MDAAIVSISHGNPCRIAASVAILRRSCAIVVTALVVLAAVLLVSRRIAGALSEHLPLATLAAMGIVTVLATVSVRRLNNQVAIRWMLSVALVLIALAVSLPGSSSLGLATLWLLVIGEEVWAWRARRERPVKRIDVAWRHSSLSDLPHNVNEPQASKIVGIVPIESPTIESVAANWSDAAATQHLKYFRSTGSVQSVEGWLRAEFVSGQRTAVVHVAFCPAFSRTPQVESEPLDGPDCEIHPTLTLPWGIRWEVKLSRAANQPTSVVLGFYANESET